MSNNLPDEILSAIFTHLNRVELLNCQQICQSWYSPAHINFLSMVHLNSYRAIKQFISTFDRTSNQTYFRAVKDIHIWPRDSSIHSGLDVNTIKKLFFRFPNLTKVQLYDVSLISNFTQDLCQKLLLHCPHLDTFDVYTQDTHPGFGNLLVKVRPILTCLLISNYLSNAADPARFITQFPRLKTIACSNTTINTIDRFLPVLEQLPNVSILNLALENDIEENFGENYFSSKPKEVQDLMKKRLSNIKALGINPHVLATNSLTFITRYFTGLKLFNMDQDLDDWDSGADLNLFCTRAIKMLPLPKYIYSFQLTSVPTSTLIHCFPTLVEYMFQRAPQTSKRLNTRVLDLAVFFLPYNPSRISGLTLSTNNQTFDRKATITVDERYSLNLIASRLFTSSANMEEIDVFVFHFLNNSSDRIRPINVEMYLKLIETMTGLKKVNFEVPISFVDTEQAGQQSYSGPVFSLVEEVTLTVAKNVTIQSLLDNLCFAFPNLKSLNIYTFIGIWTPQMGEFQLNLEEYSLQKLALDANPIVLKTKQLLNTAALFFVLDVETASERKLYQVSLDLSSSRELSYSDLKQYKRRRDYLCLRVVVKELEQLHMCTHAHKKDLVIIVDNAK